MPTIAGWQAEPATPELHQRVEEEPLDAVHAVGREQHPVVGAEQPALVDGGEFDPVRIRLEAVFDLRRVDADIVVVVGAPERMHAVGPERHRARRLGRGGADRLLQRDEPAFRPRLVSGLHVEARHARIGAHGAAVGFRRLPVLQHRLQHEARKLVLLAPQHAAYAIAVIARDLDGGARHDLASSLSQRVSGDLGHGCRIGRAVPGVNRRRSCPPCPHRSLAVPFLHAILASRPDPLRSAAAPAPSCGGSLPFANDTKKARNVP